MTAAISKTGIAAKDGKAETKALRPSAFTAARNTAATPPKINPGSMKSRLVIDCARVSAENPLTVPMITGNSSHAAAPIMPSAYVDRRATKTVTAQALSLPERWLTDIYTGISAVIMALENTLWMLNKKL